MFHAAFTALGVVTLGVGWFLVRGRSPTDRALAALALVTIVVTMLYAIVLLWLTAEDPGVVEGYGRKRALVGGLVAGLFTVGFAVPTTRLRAGGVGVMALVGPLALVVVDWATGDGAVLGPVVDVFILLTNPGVLGIEYLGVYLLVTAGALGLAFGTWAAYGAPSRATIASNPTDDTDDGDLGGESD
ncbi:hypothetical protein [Halovivax gelatinilyticus]|uniref:hypothetical protein n=1 Tax=Halovivax gelatinilyticus TaxID=2961597 RepID=UPI0020CA800A|nr:hypothetical protein [Halovivax gelatinilyticus]